MSLSSLDLSHNNLAQMAGVHLAAALVRMTALVTTVMRRSIVMMLLMKNNMSLSSLTSATTTWVHLAVVLVRITILIPTVMRSRMAMILKMMVYSMSLSFCHENLAHMVGVQLTAALVRTTMSVQL